MKMDLMILRSREGPGRVFKDVQLQRAKEFFFYFFFFFRNCFQESSSYPKFTVKDFNLKTWYGITYMRNLKRNETNELTKQKET